jgi:hypothetical protein
VNRGGVPVLAASDERMADGARATGGQRADIGNAQGLRSEDAAPRVLYR